MILSTPALVLHAFEYLESSRIIRLATRDAGVQSVLARGARRPKSRFGASLDLFTGGIAHLAVRPGRDLQTLTGFDPSHTRHGLGHDLGRFTGAAVLAELTIRFMGDAPNAEAYDAIADGLDALTVAPAERTTEVVLAAAWHLAATLGFAPSMETCASCHEPVDASIAAPFSHAAGGVLCRRCAGAVGATRPLPPQARLAIGDWIAGLPHAVRDPLEIAAHQRLLRHFVQAHLGDDRPLPAFAVWERGEWSGPPR